MKYNSTLEKNIDEDNILYERCGKDEVIVLEDSVQVSEAVHDVIEKDLGWNVIDVSNKEEVAKIIQNKKVTFCLLDNWIDDNKNEGLDALEQIRSIDKNIFTVIYSAYPSREIERRAINLGVNFIKIKSSNTHQDITEITSEYIKYELKNINYFNNKRQEQLNQLETKKSKLNRNELSINFDAYQKAKLDSEWLKKYQNKHVAFVDGEFVDHDCAKEPLLERLSSNNLFFNKKRFIARVEENKKNVSYIDEPSSMWQDFV